MNPNPNPNPNPTPSQANSKFLYVVNSIEETVLGFTINATTGALTQVGPATPAGDAPIYAAAAPNGKFLYVANGGTTSNNVSAYRIDPTTGVLTPTTPSTFKINGDSDPYGIVVDPSSTYLYTANAQSISAFRIDPTSGNLTDLAGTPVAVPGTTQVGTLALTPDGQFLYATDTLNDRVWMFSINSVGLPMRMPATVATGRNPIGIVVDASGKFAYVANWISNDVSAYTITAGTGALVGASSTVQLEVGCSPQELATDPGSKFLFVSCAPLSKIAEFAIDSTTGKLTAMPSFSTGSFTAPRGIAVDASGQFVYSTWNMQDRAGSAAVGTNGAMTAVTGTPATGRGPLGVALAGRQ